METYHSVDRPTDLITASDAAVMCGKSKSTIRAWVQKGRLTRYRRVPEIPNSALMVSAEELRTYLATKGTVTHPSNHGRPSKPSVSPEFLHAQISGLQAEKAAMAAELERVRADNDLFRKTSNQQMEWFQSHLKASETVKGDYFREIQSLNQALQELQAENQRLLKYMALPWWQRVASKNLLTG